MTGAAVSVVVPMYRTAAHLPELLRRLDEAVPGAEVVLVDDRCPEGSADLAAGLDTRSLHLVIRRLSANIGQHGAVHVGLAAATAPVVAVMDADLQDRPEALPALLAALAAHPEADAVCAARAGQYEGLGRRCTARGYRATARVLSGGRIPRGAGMFLVARRSAVDAVRALDDPLAPLVPALAAARCRLLAQPVPRDPRADGDGAHLSRQRLLIALRGLALLTPARHLLARRHRRHLAALAVEVTDVHPQEHPA